MFTVKVDNTPPQPIIIPKNFTDVSTATITFGISINDSYWGTSNVDTVKIWINSSTDSVTCGPYNMSYNTTTGNATRTFNLNFTSPCFTPGPHKIKIWVNDSGVGNINETWSPQPFIIKKVNASQLESLVGTQLTNLLGVSSTLNITYENGTDVGTAQIPAMNPCDYNYTFHFTVGNFSINIVGFKINETLAAKMNNTDINLSKESMKQIAENKNLSKIVTVWVNPKEWLPNESYYKYGEIVLNATYDAVYYCTNETNCTLISACNVSEVNLTNYESAIPNESACYINNIGNDNKTHVYVEHFSGAVGAEDEVAPTITFSCDKTTVDVGETITCTCSATDNFYPNSNISVIYTEHPSTSSSGTFTTVCIATDGAGNTNNSTISYTVKSAGGGGAVTYRTYSLTKGSKISRNLRVNDKAKFEIEGKEHTIEVKEIGKDNVTIEIRSEPITATISLGETKKFDLDDDNVYELAITLEKIVGNIAVLIFEGIEEAVQVKPSKPTVPPQQPTQPTPPTKEKEECPYECCVGEEAYKDKACPSGYVCENHRCIKQPPRFLIYIIVAVIVIVILLVLTLTLKKRK